MYSEEFKHTENNLVFQNRTQLLAKRLQEKIDAANQKQIPRRESTASLSLSYAQQRLWFLAQLLPESPLYNIPLKIHLRGELQVEVLQRSLDTMVLRHEVLRTTFTQHDGQPQQVIAAVQTVLLPVVDLSLLSIQENRWSEVDRLSLEEACRPFDLTCGPLLRATLLQLGSHEYILLLTIHHIIFDGWSLDVFFRELSSFYTTYLTGKAEEVKPLPIQYADYSVWQRQWLQGERLEARLAYWRQHLQIVPSVLGLPTDHPRSAIQSFRGTRYDFTLPSALSQALRALSQQENVTLFMTLLTAFEVLLHRYSGQPVFLLATPVANRTPIETEGLIGFFVNTLLLRADCSANPTLREMLGRVRQTTIEAYTYQDVPFERLVEELHPERDLSYTPLAQVMFILQNVQKQLPQFPGVDVAIQEVENGTSKFDLTFELREEGEILRGSVEYNTDLFEQATIVRLVGHYQRVLEELLARPEQSIGAFSLLTEAEGLQQLVQWNATQSEYPRDKCIHQLFEAQVEQTPEAVAVVFEQQQLTYRELNKRSNQLAHHLQHLGVRPETLIGICVERSLDMIVGLLSILKAGGAYVPLDPSYPQERLAFMIEDAHIDLLLTQTGVVERLPKFEGRITRVLIDSNIYAHEPIESPYAKVSSTNLAYVIYTSGSTGQPKGVLIEHQGLCNVVEAQLRILDIRPTDRVLQFASLSFDASVFEIIMTLGIGATLCLGTPGSLLPGPALIQLLRNQAITIATLPPSVLAALPTEALSTLKSIIVAGEACSADLVASWARGRRFINAYGPTETTIWATAAVCTDDGQKPAIGRPITNMQAYLLDAYLQPIPIGVLGELYIGGTGVSRGYLNLPDLTAEKFISNPFGSEPGSRLYKTGDLARYLPDGKIEFLGRIDHQIKIRGFRIELGEVEAVLGQYPKVREAIVLAREDTPANKRLVAYFIPRREQMPTINELRNFLHEKLPDYMVPSAFVLLDTLPLTPNGKVDRQALPAPDVARPNLDVAFVVPCTQAEERLAKIWGEVLGLDQVGVHDNFFALGGHSLLATQVIARIRDAFQVELPLRFLFEMPTIASLAEVVIQNQSEHNSSSTGTIPINRIN